ncbi:MAG TPA: metal-dependent hydrolase [Cyclobacteriaceae bacterium]|nr:metal-dependent hydrolase [Cyclobacteriaceae bacterium]HRJ81791.1 metal-dependent hydrolase [Cyclobacteriaceae bacterium]
MDSITHIALGAVVGEVMAGKRIGKSALLLGAIAQSLPDIDFVASFWMSFSENLLAHRGFTHSFLFIGLTAVGLAMFTDRWYQKPDMPYRSWLLFFGVQMLIHLLIDGCNAYGTGWLEPFSHERISFHFLFVADPFFSVSISIAALVLMISRNTHASRMKWAIVSLIISTAYLFYAGFNKIIIERDVARALANQNISYSRFLTTPTPLNTWLWFVAVEDDSGFHIAHRSVFDHQEAIDFFYIRQNKALLKEASGHESLQHLIRFSQGYYTVKSKDGRLIFNDLRFGQITGWANPENEFVFHFYLDHPEDNLLVIQRGRFANWNRETIKLLVKRIRGLKPPE